MPDKKWNPAKARETKAGNEDQEESLGQLEQLSDELSRFTSQNRRFLNALQEFFVPATELEHDEGLSLDTFSDRGERDQGDTLKEYLSFCLGNELYAVTISNIKEIIKPTYITSVPRTPEIVLGISSLRGTIIPVLDLRRLLGLDANPQTRKTRILIVALREELLGLFVDEVRHVIRLRDDEIEPPPAMFGRVDVEHLLGVGRHEGFMYTLLGLNSLLESMKIGK